jgi:hypothetical protein
VPRKLRALRPIFVAALAICAVTASTASATELHSEKAETILTGSSDGVGPALFGLGETTVGCTKSKFEGTTAAKDVNQITMHRTYGECETFEPGDTAFRPNHCAFILKSATDANGHGKMHIECEAKNVIEIEIGIGSPSPCVVSIGEQTPKGGGVHFTNQEENGIRYYTMSVTVKEIEYTKEGILCAFVGGNGKDMTYSGEVTIKGYEDQKSEGTPTTPIYTEGKRISVWFE